VTSYAVGNNFNAQMISDELKRQDIRVVIALGRNGLKAASTLDKEIGVVAGGVVSVPEGDGRNNAILSLAPDPALLFARLKALSPKTQRVFVVFDARQNGWLIKLANEAARSQGIELVVQQANDLKAALPIYQNIFATADGKKDALWLPQDSTTVDESLVLPLVLQESWSRSIPVFSSNVSHVKRGALFALYPNNMEMGRNLAASALGMANGNPAVRGILPLRDVLTAFNTRTASHLGLNPSTAQKKGFDLLFPEQ
jgi:putative ABC transport system substrate-binding protein